MSIPPELDLLPRPRTIKLSHVERVLAVGETRTAIDQSLPAEGYRITVSSDGQVSVDAADEAGLFYARMTLTQLVHCTGEGTLPVGEIEDWPDLPLRGAMLDVSRCKVPTLDTLYGIVDRLASWKLNHLQLYMEHTFSYTGHDEVWKDADPYTPGDMDKLSAYCRERHVALVPNQNTLGHMERWLLHAKYAPLGISRGVVTSPLGLPIPASTLDPANPGSLSLVRELIGELDDSIPATQFNVGLDEPWDLSSERIGDWSDWAAALREIPELSHHEILVWGDMLSAHPELTGAVPDGVTVCEWGYDAGHPFASRGSALGAAGIPHWMCPGTSSWLSILGRTTNAIDNCREACDAAASTGATGLLVTDWGDFGHHQYLPVADPGLAAAAAFAWCAKSNSDLDAEAIGRLLDLHSFDDPNGSLGSALVTLGNIYKLLPMAVPNMSALVLHLYLPQLSFGSGLTTGIEAGHLSEIDETIDGCLDSIARSRPGTRHGRLAASELETTSLLAKLACRDASERIAVGGQIASVAETRRAALADDLDGIIAEHRTRWLARNRLGGLDESCAWWQHLRRCYSEGTADPSWGGPLVERARSKEAQR